MPDIKKDRVVEAQMRLASFDWPPQELWVKGWSEQVLEAHRRNEALRTGQHLYLMLPKQFAKNLNGTLHDPFYSSMEKGELMQWFRRHITFNWEGKMMILRDYEKALDFMEVPS